MKCLLSRPLRWSVVALFACMLAACGKAPEVLLKVSDENGNGIAGVEVWQVGVEASLGATRGDGTVALTLIPTDDPTFQLKLGMSDATRASEFEFANSYPLEAGDLNSGKRVIRVRRIAQEETTELASWNVSTEPEGAEVIIRDEQKGTTPISITIDSPGPVEVILRKEGFEDVHFNFLLAPGSNEPIHVPLVPAEATGVESPDDGSESQRDVAVGTDDTRVASLKQDILTALGRRDWDAAEARMGQLLAAAPGDPDASRWSRDIASGRQEDRRQGKLQVLRTSIPMQIESEEWDAAERSLRELVQLEPNDPSASRWREAIATGRTASAPTTPVQPSDPVESPDEPIQRVLASYERALETLDANLYESLWQELGQDQRDRITRSFGQLKSQSVELQGTKISLTGNAAVVTFDESRTITPKVGGAQNTKRSMRMDLVQRADGAWRVARLESQ